MTDPEETRLVFITDADERERQERKRAERNQARYMAAERERDKLYETILAVKYALTGGSYNAEDARAQALRILDEMDEE